MPTHSLQTWAAESDLLHLRAQMCLRVGVCAYAPGAFVIVASTVCDIFLHLVPSISSSHQTHHDLWPHLFFESQHREKHCSHNGFGPHVSLLSLTVCIRTNATRSNFLYQINSWHTSSVTCIHTFVYVYSGCRSNVELWSSPGALENGSRSVEQLCIGPDITSLLLC